MHACLKSSLLGNELWPELRVCGNAPATKSSLLGNELWPEHFVDAHPPVLQSSLLGNELWPEPSLRHHVHMPSLAYWEMSSGRNAVAVASAVAVSLAYWEMSSGRNLTLLHQKV